MGNFSLNDLTLQFSIRRIGISKSNLFEAGSDREVYIDSYRNRRPDRNHYDHYEVEVACIVCTPPPLGQIEILGGN